MTILVTGAAGYIGSVVTEKLVEDGQHVLALDNLQNGHVAAVHPQATFLEGDLLDREWVLRVFSNYKVDAVLHLAAEALIDESVRNPGRFFRANVCAGINLLDAMLANNCRALVFSSTAAIYGEPTKVPITEHDPPRPVNSYGESKLAFERMLPWYSKAHGLAHVSLRYFNACGATKGFGEDREVETHLIPVAIQAALGQREHLSLYGTDYNTSDGTCIRDYIHVSDIASAHVLCLQKMSKVCGRAYNLGNGTGFSNLQVINTVKEVTGTDFEVIPAARRPGDPERLVASFASIATELGWQPFYTDLRTMVETAWEWSMEHPKGYAE